MSDQDEQGWLPPASCDRVVVSCSARPHGGAPRRLPDRRDSRGSIAAVLVDRADHLKVVFERLDKLGRTIYVDVERKQEANLFAIASGIVRNATLVHVKPNDVTIRSLDVLVTHVFGADLSSVVCGVYGTGNLGFKSALLLAERNAEVLVAGRSAAAVARNVEAINAILPRFHEVPVREWKRDARVACMVTAVTARRVVGQDWLERLAPEAHVIDTGVDNLDETFIAGALARGGTVLRLDTRATESQLVDPAPGFFEDAFGSSEFVGVPVVSGGAVGARGAVIVDNLKRPSMAVGVANGLGGIVPEAELTTAERERLADVRRSLPRA